MSVRRTISIDATVESVGQFDRTERWQGRLEVSREPDGQVRIGKATQSGFQALVVDWDDLLQTVDALATSGVGWPD